MNTYYLALDLHEDPALIAEYEEWHQQVFGWGGNVPTQNSVESYEVADGKS
jgi:hypothetical protein